MLDTENKEWQQALQIIQYTRRSLFLTGKAGTGKSTFLRYVAEHTKKKHVILAPTGIAAINAGGSTLHSFFRIPFHPMLPNDQRFNPRNIKNTIKYSGNQRKLFREVELIIIDEISMVRADIIDFVDKVLRIYNHNTREPFGGKQMLFVGDTYQLEPVVREEDWKMLQPFYASSYFFSAKVFQNFKLVSIELQKVYRQKDNEFIAILDRIRTNSFYSNDLQTLNKRVGTELQTKGNDLAITLTTHRGTADFINEQRLEEIEGDPITFNGEINGEFPLTSLPAPMELLVKPGAQVIFTRNDKNKQWVNGTLGVIDCIDEKEGIISIITEDGNEYDIQRETWENMRYTFNEKENKIEEELLGTFVQYPIRLAWAITVHKSQGLTFKQVNIDFTGGAFASGQTYVALSRCTSLEGISLKAPIRQRDVIVRAEVLNFASKYNDDNLIGTVLKESKADREYAEAVDAWNRRDMDAFLTSFFKAIHSRYDIEKPAVKRLIRRKLSVVPRLEQEIKEMKEAQKQKDNFLKKLSAEYMLLAKECENDKMYEAAIANYKKALELYPDNPTAKRRLRKITGEEKK